MTHRCQFHCASCDACFSSLESFDLHRAGDYESPEGRYCEEALDLASLTAKTSEGICTLGDEGARTGVTIFRRARLADHRANHPESSVWDGSAPSDAPERHPEPVVA